MLNVVCCYLKLKYCFSDQDWNHFLREKMKAEEHVLYEMIYQLRIVDIFNVIISEFPTTTKNPILDFHASLDVFL
jgi:hypothetical protein